MRTGEILAMVNLPSYNPNNNDERTGSALRNRAVVDTFEPGSTMKPLTAALALDLHKITPDTIFHTGEGVYRYRADTIHDVPATGPQEDAVLLPRASNIGMTRITDLPPPKQLAP